MSISIFEEGILEGKDMLSTKNLTRHEIELIFNVARQMKSELTNNCDLLRHKILLTFFFEPSTRTRLSFETAMQRLGGSVISVPTAAVSRSNDQIAETIENTARTIQSYADVVVVRHLVDGSSARFAEHCDIPVINAGDGDNEHPTQALLDMYTIMEERGSLDGLKILMIGDMKFRAKHSLGYALSKYNDVQVYLLSPENLRLPIREREEFDRLGLRYEEITKVEDVISELNAIYIHPTGRARSEVSQDDTYRVSLNTIKNAEKDILVLHPLPRFDELSTNIDSTPHAKYFDQVFNGVLIRMALLALLLGKA